MINFAFCNDCDFMTWEGYRAIHSYLDLLNLPAGDSFWLFDPSGCSEMALFTYDLNHKGVRHKELMDEIAAGRLDVLHSAGSYSSYFNLGFKPTRQLIEQALKYLETYAQVPRIWSNHGDNFNIQNIGGLVPADYHQGDLPESETFILDLLLEYGFEYFWLDRLYTLNPHSPYRVLAPESCRSGHTIKSFSRFFGLNCSPTASNLYKQITPDNLASFIQMKQNTIVYQHWGCCSTQDNHFYLPIDESLTFNEKSKVALQYLSKYQAEGKINVVRLNDLLREEEAKPLTEEAQRIGSCIVLTNKEQKDNFYYNQYHLRDINYFRKRVNQLGLTGGSILDAGCGVGQWSFAFSEKFTTVIGIDYNPQAYEYLAAITNGLRQLTPQFNLGSLENLPYTDHSFDAVFCYGVIMFTATNKSLREIFRVLKPGGTFYCCLNADAWDEYLLEDRFKDSKEVDKAIYGLLVWNAWQHRLGGKKVITAVLQQEEALEILRKKKLESEDIKRLIELILNEAKANPEQLTRLIKIFQEYGQGMQTLVSAYLQQYLLLIQEQKSNQNLLANIAKSLSALSLRNVRPQEFILKLKLKIKYWSDSKIPALKLLQGPFSIVKSGYHVLRSFKRLFLYKSLPPSTQNNSIPQNQDLLASTPTITVASIDEKIREYLEAELMKDARNFMPDEFQQLAESIGFSEFQWAPEGCLAAPGKEVEVPPVYAGEYQGKIFVWECLLRKK